MKIGDVVSYCPKCQWYGVVDDCIPDIDGDGSLGCPKCESVVVCKMDNSGISKGDPIYINGKYAGRYLETQNLKIAIGEFGLAVINALRIPQLLDWLSERIDKHAHRK